MSVTTGKGQNMRPQYTLDLSRYNLVELECFLDSGIISVEEFERERNERGLTYETVTPPEDRGGL